MVFFQNPLLLLLSLLSIPLFFRCFKIEQKEWKIVSLLNALLLVLLAISAAAPTLQTDTNQVVQREIVFLDDKSDSMISEGPNISIDSVSVDKRVLTSGDNSEIKKSLLNAVESNKTYLLRTDLQGVEDTKPIIDAYQERNSTINVLKTDLNDETSIKIKGPDKTVPEAENRFKINIDSTNDRNVTVEVLINGEQRLTKKTSGELTFTESFSSKGDYRIKARILDVEDEYSENNRFYKSVEVIDKPDILVVGEEGQLNEKLSDFYDVTARDTLPSQLSEYYTVVLKEEPQRKSELRTYLIDGNGMMFTGESTFDLLPVREAEVTDQTSNPSMLLALDVSTTELCSEGTCDSIDVQTSRTFAYSVVESLQRDYPGTQLGLLAYSDGYIPLVEPGLLRENSAKLKESIRSLRLQGGDEYHQLGISGSVDMLNGSGNIILVSDGVPPGGGGVYGPVYRGITSSGAEDVTDEDYKRKLLNYTENLPEDVKLFTVAVGEEGDKELDFLENLAREGGGTSYETVDEFYENPPEDIGGGGYGDERFLKVTQSNHFITSGLNNLRLATSQFDDVKTKDSASKLIATSGGQSALSSWRYGLGRVASFSTGGQDLERIIDQRPAIISRSVAWTSGDPQRKENLTIQINSARKGEEVVAISPKPQEGFNRVSENRYQREITPNNTGFHGFRNQEFAYNYRREIEGLGYNDKKLENIAHSTGGRVIDESKVNELKGEASVSKEKYKERKNLSSHILLIALILFLLQVGYRKTRGLI